MEILSEYPKQVIVLKETQKVCGLRGRRAGLQRRLIDEGQTQGFGKYCRDIEAAERGDMVLQKKILDHGRVATEHMKRMLSDVADMPGALRDAAGTFTDTEVKIIRKGSCFTDEITKTFVENILLLAVIFFKDHPRVRSRARFTAWQARRNGGGPERNDGHQFVPVRKNYPIPSFFDLALCAQILILNWISVGSPHRVKPEKMRNEIVDINFATYASFFDGILTEDKKLESIYREA